MDDVPQWFSFEDPNDTLNETDFSENLSEDIVAQILPKLKLSIKGAADTWTQMGLSRSRREKRIGEVIELLEAVATDVETSEKDHLKELLEYRDGKLVEINKILTDLTMDEFKLPQDMRLIPTAKLLHLKFEELRKVKEERFSYLMQIKSKRAELCKSMRIQPESFSMKTSIPSEAELEILQSEVQGLDQEKDKRLQNYTKIAMMIRKIYKELDKQPSADLEKEVVYGEFDKFILSKENIKKVQVLHAESETEYERIDHYKQILISKLSLLWDRLSVDEKDREGFLCVNQGLGRTVLKSFEDEIIKYEEIKKENLEMFVKKTRPEIELWLNKCCCSDTHRSKLEPMFKCEIYTDELLERHEKELSNLKQLYATHTSIFTKLSEWQQCYNRLVELEEKASDPSRFNNRGGNLLREEKERKSLMRDLPKLESAMRNLSKQYNEQNPTKTFKLYDKTIEDYFDEIWNQYEVGKENEKKERQRNKQMEIEAEMRGRKITPVVMRRTPVKRTFGGQNAMNSPGPSSASKIVKLNQDAAGSDQNARFGSSNAKKFGSAAAAAKLKQPVRPVRARNNLQGKMNKVATTDRLVVDEAEFKAGLAKSKADLLNSTCIIRANILPQ